MPVHRPGFQRHPGGRRRSSSEEVFELKRLVTAAVCLGVLLVPSTAPAARTTRTIETTPVNFEIRSESCRHLAAGTTITGTGTLTTVTWTTRRRGRRTITSFETALGTATDQAGNQYTWLYSNDARLSNTRARRRLYSGLMTDVFTLSGNGPVRLQNGFLARYVTNFDRFTRIRPVNAFGDPYDFTRRQARCDPL